MPRTGFLDTGVVIGYCLTVDHHHHKCKQYIENHIDNIFVSDTVTSEYSSTKPYVSNRYSTAVRSHIQDIEKSRFSGQLGPRELNELEHTVLDDQNPMSDTISELYDELPQTLHIDRLKKTLRKVGREIDAVANKRKNYIDCISNCWDKREEHPNVREDLKSDLHEPDLTICIEAHDLAKHRSSVTELATANPTDFVYDGTEEKILTSTDLSDIQDLSS